jgi:hypothetical protein
MKHDRFFTCVVVVIVAMIFFLGLVFVDGVSRTYESETPGKVLSKQYAPSQTHVGTGTGFDSNGNAVTTTTVSTTPEKWIVITESAYGVQAIETTRQAWGRCKVEAEISIGVYRSRVFGRTILMID